MDKIWVSCLFFSAAEQRLTKSNESLLGEENTQKEKQKTNGKSLLLCINSHVKKASILPQSFWRWLFLKVQPANEWFSHGQRHPGGQKQCAITSRHSHERHNRKAHQAGAGFTVRGWSSRSSGEMVDGNPTKFRIHICYVWIQLHSTFDRRTGRFHVIQLHRLVQRKRCVFVYTGAHTHCSRREKD